MYYSANRVSQRTPCTSFGAILEASAGNTIAHQYPFLSHFDGHSIIMLEIVNSLLYFSSPALVLYSRAAHVMCTLTTAPSFS